MPFIKSRSYIKINKPFSEIAISADKKGSDLTIDDILFSNRAMCVDGNKYVVKSYTDPFKGYRILYDYNGELLLESNVDN